MTLSYSCDKIDEEETANENNQSPKEDEKENAAGQYAVSGVINGHEYVKVAGIKWATENVGAVEGIEAASTNETCGYDYVQDNAMKVAESWGANWTLPTEEQWRRIKDECEYTWKRNYSINGKTLNGYIISDKFDSTKFVFFPTTRGGAANWSLYWSASRYGYVEVNKSYEDFCRFYNNTDNKTVAFVRPVVVGSSNDEEIPPSKIDGNINGHDYVELAGSKWATENVGEVAGLTPSATDNTYGYYYRDAKTAAESWGGTWTFPNRDQWDKLLKECDRRWVRAYSFGGKTMDGCIVSDKKDPSKYIFLPAAAGNNSQYFSPDGNPGSYVYVQLPINNPTLHTPASYNYLYLFSTGYFNTTYNTVNANMPQRAATVRPVSK